jgi:hypothetical protein
MAEFDPTKTLDFSDLGQPTKFKFNGKEFEIPSISTKKAKELMAMGRKASNDYREVLEKRKKLETMQKAQEEGEEIDQEIYNTLDDEIAEANSSFENQIAFITAVVPNVKPEEIEEWPAKMIGKVIKLINDKMSGDDIPEPEKKTDQTSSRIH